MSFSVSSDIVTKRKLFFFKKSAKPLDFFFGCLYRTDQKENDMLLHPLDQTAIDSDFF